MSACRTVEGWVKLYYYSRESQTFVEAKWAGAKFALMGIVLGTILLFGFAKLNQSFASTLGSRETHTLSAENEILRQQLSLMSPRVDELEMQTKQLVEHANRLHKLLSFSKVTGDTVRSNGVRTKGMEIQSVGAASASFRP